MYVRCSYCLRMIPRFVDRERPRTYGQMERVGSQVIPSTVLTGSGGSSKGGHSYTSNTYGCDWGHNAVTGSLRFILAVTGPLSPTVSRPQICYAIRGRDDTFYAAVAGSPAV